MERLIWQPGCRACEEVRDRLLRRGDVQLVAGRFPATPHARHGYTVILRDGTGLTGEDAVRVVRQWTGGARTALVLAATIVGLWMLACAGLAIWPL